MSPSLLKKYLSAAQEVSSHLVLKTDGERYFVHYNDHDRTWDEWVGEDRIRLGGTAVPEQHVW